MSKNLNLKVDLIHNLDQRYKDEGVLEIDNLVQKMSDEQKSIFLEKIYDFLIETPQEWFTRYLEFLQVLVPLKKDANRKISPSVIKGLLKLIFGIFDSEEDFLRTLNFIFPLYEFKRSGHRGYNYFVSESKTNDLKKFQIFLSSDILSGYPSGTLFVVLHEIAHSLNASLPHSELANIKDLADRKEVLRIYRYSAVIIFLKEYLSDLAAVMLTNKENKNVTEHEGTYKRITNRISGSIDSYPELKQYVEKYDWYDLFRMSIYIPSNLIFLTEISAKLLKLVINSVKEVRSLQKADKEESYLTKEEEDVLYEKIIELLKPIYHLYEDIADSDDEDLDDNDRYIKSMGEYDNICFFADGADEISKIANQVFINNK